MDGSINCALQRDDPSGAQQVGLFDVAAGAARPRSSGPAPHERVGWPSGFAQTFVLNTRSQTSDVTPRFTLCFA